MMDEIKKLLKLDNVDYYETHLSIINCVLPKKMTPMQIRVLATFMSLSGDIAEYRFGPSARKMIRKKLQLSDGGLSNYIGDLLEAGFISKDIDTKKITILPILLPEDTKQDYRFRLIKEIQYEQANMLSES